MSTAALRGQIGAHAKWAKTTDRMAATQAGRVAAATALEQRLIEEYDLDPTAKDFSVRLEHARKAHFKRLALRSAAARKRKERAS